MCRREHPGRVPLIHLFLVNGIIGACTLWFYDHPSHGFLCSRCTKSRAVLPCLDWAMEMSHGSTPVMSTFYSELEVAVLDILLKGICLDSQVKRFTF